MKHFTKYNTKGFSREELNKMNNKMLELGADNLNIENQWDYDKYSKLETEVFNQFNDSRKMEKMIIALDSCNGEEEQFENWMNKNYPEIKTVIENTLKGGLYEWNEEYGWELIPDNYWDQYCSE